MDNSAIPGVDASSVDPQPFGQSQTGGRHTFTPDPRYTGSVEPQQTPATMTRVAGKYTQAIIAIGEGDHEDALDLGRQAVELHESLLGVPPVSHLSDSWRAIFADLAADLSATAAIAGREEPLTEAERIALSRDLTVYARLTATAVRSLGGDMDLTL